MKRISTAPAGGFTLVEWLVTMTILALLIVLAAQVCNGARWIQCTSNRRLDADEEARSVFDRMAMDFAQMLRRPDVDYWLKDDVNRWNDGTGNDQLAFFSSVPGYYPEDAWNSPISVVGYWVDPVEGLQRHSCGLLWNGMARADPQMIFAGVSRSNGSGTNTLLENWPGAIKPLGDDGSEPAGAGVFRMEYYYVLRSDAAHPPTLSALPWQQGGASVNGLRDVAAFGVVLAIIDARGRALLSQKALGDLAGAMENFSATTTQPGDLEARWQAALQTSGLPPAALSSIRIYRRWFYLSPLHAPGDMP
ncbi:MAG: type II secretion system protein J [Chthoniobacteraceae bacterium]